MKCKSLIVCLALFSAVFMLAIPANANLLTNGDFDADVGLTGTNWAVFNSIPGWTTYSGKGIEVQRNTIVTAHSGNQYVELDSNPAPGNSGMKSGDLYLAEGWYHLEFYYQPRTATETDNIIDYGISGGVLSDTIDNTNPPQNYWGKVSETFEITTAGNYYVYFAAGGINNTLGGFVDTVSLTGVPEPATLLLLGLGLLGVAGIRRFRR